MNRNISQRRLERNGDAVVNVSKTGGKRTRCIGVRFINAGHCCRMGQLFKRADCPFSSVYTAAAYLLTANADIYARTVRCFHEKNQIVFDLAAVRGISINNYTLLHAAKCIYLDDNDIGLNDLVNRTIMDSRVFFLITNALWIARCGYCFLDREGTYGIYSTPVRGCLCSDAETVEKRL